MNDAVPSRSLLFIGDSITDAGRREDPEHLGFGYVRLIAEHIAAHEPGSTVVNTGIGGDRVRDLVSRFDPDCLDHAPDVVTIYVGVNDTWRRYDSDDATSADDFEAEYRYLLDQLSAIRPGTPVILILPFVADIDEEKARYHEDLDEKVARVRDLAREFGHAIVDTEEILERAYADGHTPATIAEDGVHPSIAGHRLIADAWLQSYAEIDQHRG
ncbi:lysophospholipase [Brachybacterium endophyticum]|uniref:Lysophospholipase n=1 Tax=Brachybacterium endophyticum TaxID=2182385 RepID=A0A2U2RHP0_9MICO|nr:SGNH/GDSL hydrolase family protein [Brachybacterium endophyticum]PWH05364.1 lysophospholipase [Brachybacterium endophyticum]